jgi:hypothetical protein
MERSNIISTVLRISTIALIIFSILVTYYVKVIQQDYVIFTNPEGPETEEYFEELFAE